MSHMNHVQRTPMTLVSRKNHKKGVQNPVSSLRCARSRGDTNRSEHHAAFSEMKKMTRKCAVSCQVVVRQFTDCNIL